VATRVYPVCLVGFFIAGAGTAILFPMAMVAAGRVDHGTVDQGTVDQGAVDPTRAIAGAATVGYLGWVLAPGLIGGVASLLSLPTAVGTSALFLGLAALLAGSLRPAGTGEEAAASAPH
jgi:hypothetical protein